MPSNAFRHPLYVVAALSLSAIPGIAPAATFCADDAAELVAQLQSAALSLDDDTIRVRSGTFTLGNDISLAVSGDLSISGGWSAACVAQSSDPEATRITNAVERQYLFELRPRADLTVERLTFDRIERLIIQDLGSSTTAVGTTRLARNRFISNEQGPLLRPRDSNLRVENNLITGSRLLSLAIDRSGAIAPFVADIHNNTIFGDAEGTLIAGTPGAVRFRNNVLFGGATDGRLSITEGAVTVNHNRVGAISLQSGGTASPASDNLIGVDPQLDPDTVPLPGSPMLNSGSNSIGGGLPATDYLGNPRKIGSRVDRGARESAISDISTLVVTSTSNSGAGSLRQAIIDANFTPAEETIAFSITGACPRVITLATPLPTILSTTTIDGFTQQGASANTNADDDPDGDNSIHCVALAADGASAFNLQPAANQEITLRGLAFYRASGAQVLVSGAGRATIVGNTFNTGTSLFETQVPQYAISIAGANGSRVGGSDRADRNIIGRASIAGIRLLAGEGRFIESNWIGIGKSGQSDVGNALGVSVSDGRFDSIDGNAIGHSDSHAILVDGQQSTAAIQRNLIGRSPNASGMASLVPNGGNGIRLVAGDPFSINVNLIASSGSDGIAVLGGVRNADFRDNVFRSNDGLGLDLAPAGVNPIDTDTGAAGANNEQNFPELLSAQGGVRSGVVTGRLQSANGRYSVMLYRSSQCDPSGHGEGSERVGGVIVTITNGTTTTDGVAPFSAPISTEGSLIDDDITAIATREGPGIGSSSEFSACAPYVVEDIHADGFEP